MTTLLWRKAKAAGAVHAELSLSCKDKPQCYPEQVEDMNTVISSDSQHQYLVHVPAARS